MKAQLKAMNSRLEAVSQELKAAKDGKPSGAGIATGSGNKEGKCWTCGKEGHVKKDCPDRRKKTDNDGDKTPADADKWAAPKPGEPLERMINGKLFKYCATCTSQRKARSMEQDSYYS